MIISLDNLKAGLSWWRKSNWPQDMHNEDYYDIYGDRAGGPTERWWELTVHRLSQWRAYRGPKPPNTKTVIRARGVQTLSDVASQYVKLMGSAATEPSIADLNWEHAANLFALASAIKPRSPVFAGKMCHFLFPKLFIVMDNLGTGVLDYEFYWRGMKDEWTRFQAKTEARDLVELAIQSKKPLHPLYPFETKIMELSHVGYKHG